MQCYLLYFIKRYQNQVRMLIEIGTIITEQVNIILNIIFKHNFKYIRNTIKKKKKKNLWQDEMICRENIL